MTIENRLTYTDEQRQAMIVDEDKGPVCMVNLLVAYHQ